MIAERTPFFDDGLLRTTGAGATADYIREMEFMQRERLKSAVAFGFDRTLDELNTIAWECREPDWCGYPAAAVSEASVLLARLFIDRLPIGAPLPAVNAEPDGQISLEWYKAPRWIFSISFDPNGTLHYAGLFSDEKIHGSQLFFTHIPSSIMNLIMRVVR